jgi:hypothetical protein
MALKNGGRRTPRSTTAAVFPERHRRLCTAWAPSQNSITKHSPGRLTQKPLSSELNAPTQEGG